MKTIDRIYLFAEYKSISIYKLSKKIEVSNGYLAKQRENKANLGSHIIEKIAIEYPELSLDWLITGEGEMLNNDNFNFTSKNVSQTAIGGINIAGGAEGNKVSVKNGDDSDKQKILKKDYQKLEKENQKLKEKILRLEKQIDKLFAMVGDK